jgi:hypothetical protein
VFVGQNPKEVPGTTEPQFVAEFRNVAQHAASNGARAYEVTMYTGLTKLDSPRATYDFRLPYDLEPNPFDSNAKPGTREFVHSLRLEPQQEEKVADLFRNTQVSRRDELAQLAKLWGGVEHHVTTPPTRLILSGHSTGAGIYGEEHRADELPFVEIQALARAFPYASSKVEDLFISACNCAGQRDAFKEVFPNLKTAEMYKGAGSSPTGPGAIRDINQWLAATIGHGTTLPRLANAVPWVFK